MGANQAKGQRARPQTGSTVLKRNSSSFHGLQSLRKEQIEKRWKFYSQEQALSKYEYLEKKKGKCDYFLNISEVKCVKGNKGEYYVIALVEYPQHNVYEEIIKRRNEYRTFDEEVLWSCLVSVTKAILQIRKQNFTYFPSNLSQIFYTHENCFKIKDPTILPPIKSTPKQTSNINDSQELSLIIFSMGILEQNIKFSLSDINKFAFCYSHYFSALLHKMYRQNLNLNQILDYSNCRKNVSQINMPLFFKQKVCSFPREKSLEPERIWNNKQGSENREQFFKCKKKTENLKRKEEIKPKKIVTPFVEKENNSKIANIEYSEEPGYCFPKNVRVLRKTCQENYSASVSPTASSLPIQSKKTEVSEHMYQDFLQINESRQLMSYKSNESIFESIIDEESIIQQEESPVAALVQELDILTESFIRIQNCLVNFDKQKECEKHLQFNSVIIEVSEENQQSKNESQSLIRNLSICSLVSENENKVTFIVEDDEVGGKYEGEAIDGIKNGFGRFFSKDGTLYEGQWKNNEKEGFGKLYSENEEIIYEGYWKNGEYDGKGKITNKNTLTKNETILNEKWLVYEGQFIKGMKYGKGQMTLESGYKLRGIWFENSIKKQLKEVEYNWLKEDDEIPEKCIDIEL